MASQIGNTPFPLSEKSQQGAHIIARQDRIPGWSFPYLFIFIIGLGFLFMFYDIFDINVSFIQSCTEIVPGCSAVTAAGYLGLPTLLNLVGYVLGALFFSPLADRYGRRNVMVFTLLITGLGSLYTGLSNDLINFDISRLITGLGIGADLAIVTTYISEMAPIDARWKHNPLAFTIPALHPTIPAFLALNLPTPVHPL